MDTFILVFANTTVTGLAVWIVQHFMQGKQNETLEKIRSELESKRFASTELYAARNKTIFEFDLAIRSILGPCQWLSRVDLSMHDENLKFDKVIDANLHDARVCRLKGQLVFDDNLFNAARELEIKANAIGNDARSVLSYANKQSFDSDLVERMIDKIDNKLLPEIKPLLSAWTQAARKSLAKSPDEAFAEMQTGNG